MRIGGGHRDNQKGAIAVVGVLKNSPFMAAYRFDADATSSNPWTKYTTLTGNNIPDLTNGYENMADIAVCPENNKVVVGGWGTMTSNSHSSKIQVYDFDVASADGFGSHTDYTASGISGGASDDLNGVHGLAFSQDKSVLAVATGKRVIAYNWANGAITSVKWRQGASEGLNTSINTYAYSAIGFWPYNESHRDGPNEMVVASERSARMGFPNYIHTHNIDTGELIRKYPINTGGGTGYGFIQSPVKLSPKVIFGSRTAIGESTNTDNNPDRMYGFAYQVEDGSEVSYPAAYLGPNTNRIGTDEYTAYNMWDPYGRVISARTDPNDIKIYEQSLQTAEFSLVASYSDDIGAWGGGHINSMAYDRDRDILFVCSRSAPYLTAVKMGQNKFVHKYTDISVSDQAGSSFVRASLMYDEKWKCFNT